jgi:quinol monooxygenase YgiN
VEVFVFARLHARPGKRDEVHQAMFEVQLPTRNEPGCLAYGAFQSVRDPDEFYIHSRWQDTVAFDLHTELPHTIRFIQTVEPLLDHPFRATLSERLW